MLWQEDKKKQPFIVPDEIADLVFNINCKQVPLDHCAELSQSIIQVLPWIADEPYAAIQMIHGASTGNGWQRPENNEGDPFIHLSKRSKMHIRLPKTRHADAEQLIGQTLQIGGNSLEIGQYQVKAFSPIGTQFSRYVILLKNETEDQFMQRMVNELKNLGIQLRKALCGTRTTLVTPQGPVETINFMVADLNPDEAIILQKHGIGEGQKMGFGVFIAHKGIDAVGSEQTHFSGT